jgi:hypothetical protein
MCEAEKTAGSLLHVTYTVPPLLHWIQVLPFTLEDMCLAPGISKSYVSPFPLT